MKLHEALANRWDRERLKERILNGITKNAASGCWEWNHGKTSCGYGAIYVDEVQFSTHHVSYELFVGVRPSGFDIDHLCRNRGCCNPEHLEAVTRRENLMRGKTLVAANAAVTHCPKGHEYTPDNTIKRSGQRSCRQCSRVRASNYYNTKRSDAGFMANKRATAKRSYEKLKSTK